WLAAGTAQLAASAELATVLWSDGRQISSRIRDDALAGCGATRQQSVLNGRRSSQIITHWRAKAACSTKSPPARSPRLFGASCDFSDSITAAIRTAPQPRTAGPRSPKTESINSPSGIFLPLFSE